MVAPELSVSCGRKREGHRHREPAPSGKESVPGWGTPSRELAPGEGPGQGGGPVCTEQAIGETTGQACVLFCGACSGTGRVSHKAPFVPPSRLPPMVARRAELAPGQEAAEAC